MIFHCWDNNARRLAHDAALDLLKGELPQNVYVAIMTIDFKLEVLQAFTNDTALLRQAIDRATRSNVADFSKDTESVRRQLEQMLGPAGGAQTPQEQINSSAPTVTGGGPPANPGAFATAAMAQMLLEMILDRTELRHVGGRPGHGLRVAGRSQGAVQTAGKENVSSISPKVSSYRRNCNISYMTCSASPIGRM